MALHKGADLSPALPGPSARLRRPRAGFACPACALHPSELRRPWRLVQPPIPAPALCPSELGLKLAVPPEGPVHSLLVCLTITQPATLCSTRWRGEGLGPGWRLPRGLQPESLSWALAREMPRLAVSRAEVSSPALGGQAAGPASLRGPEVIVGPARAVEENHLKFRGGSESRVIRVPGQGATGSDPSCFHRQVCARGCARPAGLL